MYDYRKQMLKEYHEKLEEYRELLGALPTDETATLERIISNPENEREMDFCINCLKFFNYSTKGFTNITEELRQNKISERDIDRWLENIDGLLYHHRYTFETKKEYYQNLLEQRKDLIQKIQIWTNETLTSILLEPTTDEEYRLCQEYLSYLSDEVDFKERKDKYLERLMNRQETIKELSKSSYKTGMIEILLDPRTEKELDFCISYFGFVDDKKRIMEAVQEGRIKQNNLNNSTVVNHVVGIVNILMNDEDMQDKLFFLRDAAKTADVLYELSILESNKDELVHVIATRLGYNTTSKEINTSTVTDFFRVYIQYEAATSLINDLVFYGIDREDKHNKINKFLNMAELFHARYVTDTYEDASGSKTTQKEESKIKQKKPTETK